MNQKKAKLLRKEMRLRGITGQTQYEDKLYRTKPGYYAPRIVLGKCFRKDYKFFKKLINQNRSKQMPQNTRKDVVKILSIIIGKPETILPNGL